jgi:hypothetical protein
MLTLLGQGLTLLLSPLAAAVVAVGGVVATIYHFREEIRAFYKEYLGYDPFALMASGVDMLLKGLKLVGSFMRETFDYMLQLPQQIEDRWNSLKDFASSPMQFTSEWLNGEGSVAEVAKGRRALGMGTTAPYNYTGNPVSVDVNVKVNDGTVQGLIDASIEQKDNSKMEAFRNNTAR